MAAEVVTIEGNAALASFWPSIASASAQIRRRRHSQRGQVQSGNPAVAVLGPPVLLGHRRLDRSARGPR